MMSGLYVLFILIREIYSCILILIISGTDRNLIQD